MGNLLRNKRLVAIVALVVLVGVGGYLLFAPDTTEKKKPIVVERAKLAQPEKKSQDSASKAQGADQTAPKREVVGTVSQFKGLAFANFENVKRTLSDGAPLFQGDQIITGREGRIILKMRDDAVVALGPDSEFLIQEYQFAPKEQAGNGVVHMTQGMIRFTSGKLAQMKNQPFKVVTPVATLGVRGTEGFVRLGDGKGKDREIEVLTLHKQILVWMEEAARPGPVTSSSLGEIYRSWGWSLVSEAQAADTGKQPLSVNQNERLSGSPNKAPEIRKATRDELKAAHASTAIRKLSPSAVQALRNQAAKALVEQGGAPDLATAEKLLAKSPDAIRDLVDKAEAKLEKELDKAIDKKLDQIEKLEKLDSKLKESMGEEAFAQYKKAEEQRESQSEALQQERDQKLKNLLGNDAKVEEVKQLEADKEARKDALIDKMTEEIAKAEAEKDTKKQAALKAELDKKLAALDKETDQTLKNLLGSDKADQIKQADKQNESRQSQIDAEFAKQIDAVVPADSKENVKALQQQKERIQSEPTVDLSPLGLSRVSESVQAGILKSLGTDMSAFADGIVSAVKSGTGLEQALQRLHDAVQARDRQEASRLGVTDLDSARKLEQEARQAIEPSTPSPEVTPATEAKPVTGAKPATEAKTEGKTPESESKTEGKPTTDTKKSEADAASKAAVPAPDSGTATTTVPGGLSPSALDPSAGGNAGSSGASNTTTTTSIQANQSPVMETQSFTIQENAPAGTVVGTLIASDADTVDQNRLTFTLGGSSAFAVGSKSGQITVVDSSLLDFETTPTFTLTAAVKDARNATTSATVLIKLTNVNEAPTITSTAAASFAENATGTVYQATATDPDSGDTKVWSLSGSDASLFAINSATGAVTFNAAPDYETPKDSGADNTYDITVVATDAAGAAGSKAVAITVTNVNEAPTVSSPATASFVENGTGIAYQATVSDPDANDTFAWTLSGTDAALFSIQAATGAVSFKQAPDYESPKDAGADNVYDFSVTVTDGGNLSATRAVALTVTAGNDAPTITSGSAVSFVENGTGIAYQATATDPDVGDTRSWTLSGVDASLFAIDSATGAVTFKQSPDFESPKDAGGNNVYDLSVTVTDAGGLSSTKAVAITVTHVNEAPSVLSGTTATFPENGTGTVYQGIATDPDAGDRLNWSLSGTDAALFVVDASSGMVTFKQSPNFELPQDAGANNIYDVVVTVTDQGGLTSARAVAITVTDVNEAPTVTSGATVSFAEKATGTVYQATATDPDVGDTRSWTLSGVDASLFAIDSATGVVTFKQSPDYEAPKDAGGDNVYDLNVTVTDAGGLSGTKAVAITVTNVNEAPIAFDDTATATEAGGILNGTPGTPASGTVLGNDTDVDAGTTLTVTAIRTGGVEGSGVAGTVGVALTGAHGSLTQAADGTFVYTVNENDTAVQALAAGQSLTDLFNYTVSDGALTDTGVLTITIQGANDAPVAVDDAGSATEAGGTANGTPGSPATGNVLTNDTDVDAGATLQVTAVRLGAVEGSGAAGVPGSALSGNYGVLTLAASGAYTYVVNESHAAVQALKSGQSLVDAFNYSVSDGALSDQGVLTITIQGVNDAPVAQNDSGVAIEAGGVANGSTGSQAAGHVLTNDTDPENDTLFVTAVRVGSVEGSGSAGTLGSALAGTYGSLVLNGSGDYTYAVNESDATIQALQSGQSVTDSFNYTVSDGALTDIGVLTITIQGSNDAPTITSAATVNFAENGTGPVYTATATDPENHGITWSLSGTDAARFSMDATTGVIRFLATPDYEGPTDANLDRAYEVVITATDDGVGNAASSMALTISVTDVNEAPVGQNDTGTAIEAGGVNNTSAGSDASGNVLTNDQDADANTTLTVTAIRLGGVAGSGSAGVVGSALTGTYGTLTVSASGDYQYVVNNTLAAVQVLQSGQTLSESFNYTLSDGALSATAVLTVTIQGANDAPVAVDDTASATRAGNGAGVSPGTASGNVLSNDSDVEGDTLTVSALRTGAVEGSGTSGTLGSALSGSYGTLTMAADGSYLYTINESATAVLALSLGQTLTDSFNYTVTDSGWTDTAVLTITILGNNSAPVAVDDSATAIEAGGTGNATAGSNASGDLLANDTDAESNTLSVTAIRLGAVEGSGTAGAVGSALSGTYGTLTVSGSGVFTYVVNDTLAAVQALQSGQSLTESFNYTVSDGSMTDTAVLTITIQGANDAPVAADDTGTATDAGGAANATAGSNATGNLLSNDTDPESDALSVTAVRLGAVEGSGSEVAAGTALVGTYGTLTVTGSGSYTYVVDSSNATVEALTVGQSVTESFNYTVSDGQLTDTALLTITIQGVNDAPVAVADSGTAVEAGGVANATAGSNATGNLLTNDTDVDTGATLTVTAVRTGSVAGSGSAGTVGGSLSGSYGALTVTGTGAYTYVVDDANATVQALQAGQSLTESFNYTVSDGSLTSDAVLTITIQGANDAPSATDDTGTATEAGGTANGTAGVNATGNVLSNDIDVESDTLTVTAVRTGNVEGGGTAGTVGSSLSGTYGALVLNASGAYTYVVNDASSVVQALQSGQSLTDAFNYTVSDGALTDTALLTITIQGANDAPTITSATSVSVAENTVGTFYTATATDPEGDSVTWSVSGTDADRFSIDATTGALSFLIAPDYENPTDSGADNLYDVTLVATDSGSGTLAGTLALSVTVTNANDAPTITSPASVSATEDTPVSISFAVADVDSGTNTIQATLAVANGTLTLNAGSGVSIVSGSDASAGMTLSGTVSQINTAVSNLVYQGTTDFSGQEILTLVVDDLGNTGAGGAMSATATVTFTVAAVNDAPVITAPASATVTEDVAATISGFAITDVDVGTGTMQATLSATNGTLTLTSGSGVSVTSGADSSASMVITGTLTQLNTALGTLTYQGTANYNGSETLTLTVSDLGNTGSGNAQTATASFTFTITAVNDAPVITQPTLSATEDTALVISGLSVSDVDAGTGTLQATLGVTNGTLTLASGSGVTLTSGADASASMVITGTLTQLNAALSGMTYQGTLNYNGTETLTLTVSDQGNTGPDGAQSATASIGFTVAAVNDAPVLAAPTSATVTEDVAAAITGFVITDVDVDTATMQATLTATNGTLTLTTGSGVTVASGADSSSSMVITGTLTQLNTALSTLTYQGNTDYNGAETITVTVSDQGNTGTGGALTATATLSFTITAVNDTPVITQPTLSVNEDTALVITGLSVSDPDAGTGTLQATLGVTNGTLTLASGSGVTLTSGADASASLVITGTLTQLNAALSGMTYQGTLNYNGTDTLTLTISDQGNTGPDGTKSATATMSITVAAVNDAPVISGSPTPSINVDVAGSITGLSVTDVDVGTATLQATLSMSHGTITLATGSGVTITSGADASASMVFTGTLTQVNAAIATMTYLSDSGYLGSETVTLTISDQGNTGSGGTLTATTTVTFTITAVGTPTDITLSNTSLYENADPGSHVGLLGAVDSETGDTFTFTVTADPDSLFDIRTSGTSSYLIVRSGATPTVGSHSVTLQVADAAARTFSKSFTITVTAVPFDLDSAADVDSAATVKSNAETLFKSVIATMNTASSSMTLTNANLRTLILGKLGQQFTTGGSFTYGISDVIKRMTVEVMPADDPTVIRILVRVGVINSMYSRLPSSVQSVFDGLFDTFAPYATDYTTDVRIRLVPIVSNTAKTIAVDTANSTVEVLHLQMLPNISMSFTTLLSAYNTALTNLKSDGTLTFFTGGGGHGPSAHVLSSALGTTGSEGVTLHSTLKTTAVANGITAQYVEDGNSQQIPTSQRFDYYLPGLITSISLSTGGITLSR
ncbi:MAG: tandem-95 repeat protein [Magnetococcales bacterium]|nr:tandem-95 repeat protein [Magnetococcales bacterium]